MNSRGDVCKFAKRFVYISIVRGTVMTVPKKISVNIIVIYNAIYNTIIMS